MVVVLLLLGSVNAAGVYISGRNLYITSGTIFIDGAEVLTSVNALSPLSATKTGGIVDLSLSIGPGLTTSNGALTLAYPLYSCPDNNALSEINLLSGATICVPLSSGSTGGITGSGTAGYLPYWSDTTTLGITNVYYDEVNGRVGIGTTSPTERLHVEGNLYSSSYVKAATGICIGTDCRTSWPSGISSVEANTPLRATTSGSTVTLDLNVGTGLTVSNGNLTVVYGSTSGTAVEGNTQVTISAGLGLTGGGTITLGQGGTVTISHADTSTATSTFNTGGTVIQNITLDDYGHVTGTSSVDLNTLYVPLIRNINTSAPLSGGGPLSSDLTLSLNVGTGLEINSATGALEMNITTPISCAAGEALSSVNPATGEKTCVALSTGGAAVAYAEVNGNTGSALANTASEILEILGTSPITTSVTSDTSGKDTLSVSLNYDTTKGLDVSNGSLYVKVGAGLDYNASGYLINTGDINPSDDITGSGTAGYIPKFTGSNTVGDSNLIDSGTRITSLLPLSVGSTAPRTTSGVRITLPGSTSDYIITVQDGTGRVEHYWNAKPGTSPTYLVSSEPAAKLRISPPDTKFFNIYWAPVGIAGASITWQEKFAVDTSGVIYASNATLSGVVSCSGSLKTDINGTLYCGDDNSGITNITGVSPVVVSLSTDGTQASIELNYNSTYFSVDNNQLVLSVPYADGTAYDARFINVGEAAGGDLNGTYPNPVVSGLLGYSLPALNTGALYWNGTAWAFQVVDTDPTDDVTAVSPTAPITASISSGTLSISLNVGTGLTVNNGNLEMNVTSDLNCSTGYALQSVNPATGAVACVTVDTDPTNELQNVFSNVSDGINVASADSTSDTLTIQGGEGISVSVDSTTDTVTITNTGDTNASDDLTVSTVFSGDVSGPYNNLQLNVGVVGTNELADDSVTSTKIVDGSIQVADINTADFNNVYDSRYINEGQAAGGDLSGTYPNPTVAKIQGQPVSTTAPSTGQALVWDGLAWSPKTVVQKQVYTTPGVYSILSPGDCLVYIYLVGGGGSGGSGAQSNNYDPGGGGGGGGSGAMVAAILQVTAGEAIDVTVGGSDQNSSVAISGITILTAGAGGRGGDGLSDGTGGLGGAGGTYSINYSDSHLVFVMGAENGLNGANALAGGYGGSGGDSVFINGSLAGTGGSGGASGTDGTDGSAGQFYGAGGGGGGGSTTGTYGIGGPGAPGVAILTFVCN